MNYAKAKFLLSLAVATVYWPLSILLSGKQVTTEDEQSKSFFMFISLVTL